MKSVASQLKNPQAVLREAQAQLKSGEVETAKASAVALLQRYPMNIDAHCFLAQCYSDQGADEQAIAFLQKAFELGGEVPRLKKMVFAIFTRYLTLKDYPALEMGSRWLTHQCPKDGVAWDFLAIAFLEQGKFREAYAAAMQAVHFLPDNPNVLNNLGYALTSLDRCAEAVVVLRRALEFDPKMVTAHNNLGNALRFIGDYPAALACFNNAITLEPDLPYLYNNLGLTYRALNQCGPAIESYQHALALNPDLVQVYPNLMEAYRHSGQVRQAIDCGKFALSLDQTIPEMWAAHGDALRDGGFLDEAIDAYIRAVSFRDDAETTFNRKVYTNILFCLNYHPDLPPEVIYDAYRTYDQRFGLSLRAKWRPFEQQRDPKKRLKVGYVCQSYFNQVCRYFLIPLFEKHNRAEVEIFAYAQIPYEDEVTQVYKSLVDHWVPIRSLTDDQVVERIRADGIDILVDVSGHTNENRLIIFAQKPAPVSLHWLEYGYTTGLSAIDYFMTDRASVTAESAPYFSEKIWCLDGPAYVYRPDAELAVLNESPAAQTGIVTFGCLSRTTRINHRVVRIWAAILDAMPNSRLMINSADFKDPIVREEMASRFMRYGIERERLDIGYSTPSWEVLKHVDIGLDCFPHNSGTTLLETLYMGIPFVTLLERPSVGRIGASVLTGMGRTEWIASTEEEYAQKAIILAHDIEGLVQMRKTMRQEMQASLLMNEGAFARSVEKAYRQMWQIYCEGENS